jgi:hypothetical protein
MGRRSRRRIRAGQQAPAQRRTGNQGAGFGTWPFLSRQIEERFEATLTRFDAGHGSQAGGDLDVLAGWWKDGTGQATIGSPGPVPMLICSYLCGELDRVWAHGWQPCDIPRVVGKHLSPRHARLVVDAIAEHAESYRHRSRTLPPWLDQLDEIGADLRWNPETDYLALAARELHLDHAGMLRTAFELLVTLHHLPSIPVLCPPPSQWDDSTALDAAMAWRREVGPGELRHLERIRALLAKAESTEFEGEAESLTAKAQELMTRHSIDAALLAAHASDRRSKVRPGATRIGIDDPYASAKSLLLARIAEAANCSAVWSKDFGFSTVFGFDAELVSVELLYTSLLLQARTTMARAGDLGQRAKGRAFRQSFLVGFATRIGQRLKESAQSATAEALKDHGSQLLPVLADRTRAAEECRNDAFPGLTQHTLAANDRSGWGMGVATADQANIQYGALLEEKATG